MHSVILRIVKSLEQQAALDSCCADSQDALCDDRDIVLKYKDVITLCREYVASQCRVKLVNSKLEEAESANRETLSKLRAFTADLDTSGFKVEMRCDGDICKIFLGGEELGEAPCGETETILELMGYEVDFNYISDDQIDEDFERWKH